MQCRVALLVFICNCTPSPRKPLYINLNFGVRNKINLKFAPLLTHHVMAFIFIRSLTAQCTLTACEQDFPNVSRPFLRTHFLSILHPPYSISLCAIEFLQVSVNHLSHPIAIFEFHNDVDVNPLHFTDCDPVRWQLIFNIVHAVSVYASRTTVGIHTEWNLARSWNTVVVVQGVRFRQGKVYCWESIFVLLLFFYRLLLNISDNMQSVDRLIAQHISKTDCALRALRFFHNSFRLMDFVVLVPATG